MRMGRGGARSRHAQDARREAWRPSTPSMTASTPRAGHLLLGLVNGSWAVFAHLPGWTTSSGPGIEVQNNVAGGAFEGAQFVELDSHAASSMFQDVRTTPGSDYELRVAYSPRPGTGPDDNKI